MIVAAGESTLGFVGGVLGLAVLLGGVVAVLFSQLRKNTTAIVREENGDLRQRLSTVETAEEQCKTRLSELEITTKHLADMLTGAAAVAELATTVAFNHAETMKRLDELGTKWRLP